MRKVCSLLVVLLFVSSALAQSSVTIDKLERTDLGKAKMEVSFSALLEGTVSSQDVIVYVMVHQPHLKGWRLFPASIDPTSGGKGTYRWRAICQFGEFRSAASGTSHQVRAVAFDKAEIMSNGLPKSLPNNLVKSNTIVLKRTK